MRFVSISDRNTPKTTFGLVGVSDANVEAPNTLNNIDDLPTGLGASIERYLLSISFDRAVFDHFLIYGTQTLQYQE
jgi:hypothetical protein